MILAVHHQGRRAKEVIKEKNEGDIGETTLPGRQLCFGYKQVHM